MELLFVETPKNVTNTTVVLVYGVGGHDSRQQKKYLSHQWYTEAIDRLSRRSVVGTATIVAHRKLNKPFKEQQDSFLCLSVMQRQPCDAYRHNINKHRIKRSFWGLPASEKEFGASLTGLNHSVCFSVGLDERLGAVLQSFCHQEVIFLDDVGFVFKVFERGKVLEKGV